MALSRVGKVGDKNLFRPPATLIMLCSDSADVS